MIFFREVGESSRKYVCNLLYNINPRGECYNLHLRNATYFVKTFDLSYYENIFLIKEATKYLPN